MDVQALAGMKHQVLMGAIAMVREYLLVAKHVCKEESHVEA